MKKILTLTFVVMFILCGCGKNQANNQSSENAADNPQSETEANSATAVIVTDDKELGEYTGVFISKYVGGGKFYIKEATISADGTKETVELATDGAKTAKRSGNTTQIVDSGMLYLVMHDQKAVLTSPVADVMAENMTMSLGIKNEQDAEKNLLSTGKEDVDGTQYSFEEYKNGEGTIKYYFDSQTLRYIKHISSEGSEQLYQIETISSEIPSGFFDVPDDYKFQDFSSIAKQAD